MRLNRAFYLTLMTTAGLAVGCSRKTPPPPATAATTAPATTAPVTRAAPADAAAAPVPDAGAPAAPETTAPAPDTAVQAPEVSATPEPTPDTATVTPRKGKTDPVWADPKTHAFVLHTLEGDAPGFQPAGGGAPVAIPDGAIVEHLAKEAAGAEDGEAVVWNGKRGSVPPGTVFDRTKLVHLETPAGAVEVATAISGCGDVCHTRSWLLFADGSRVSLDDDAVHPTVALSPDKQTLAFGGRVLVLADLAAHAAFVVPSLTAPAWAPDGSLWARDAWQYMRDDAIQDCFAGASAPKAPCDAQDPKALAASGDRVWRLAAAPKADAQALSHAKPELALALPGQLEHSQPGADAPAGAPVTFTQGQDGSPLARIVFVRDWSDEVRKRACAVCGPASGATAPRCSCAADPASPQSVVVALPLAPKAP